MSWTPVSALSQNVKLRSAMRRTGITRLLSSMLPVVGSRSYESRVDSALAAQIRRGDCVWDVGANVGLYTTRFAELAGPDGSVVAFEPVGHSYERLVERTRHLPNVETRFEALGASPASFTIALLADPTSPSNSLANRPSDSGEQSQLVTVASADELVEQQLVPPPSVLKIDTEGYEEEVLWGARKLLRNPQLRSIIVEVHFAQLESRGYPRAPARISGLLADAGFRLTWLDLSHLLATRSV